MKRYCDIERVDIMNDDGRVVGATRAICTGCGAEVESYGQERRSIKRCMALMRDECECDDVDEVFFVCNELEDE